MSDISLSDMQNAGVKKIRAWHLQCRQELKDGKPLTQQVFRVFGFAGSGKSTTVKYALEELGKPSVLSGTFTGKAALVLSRKGTPATTIHSMAYKVQEPSKEAIDTAKMELAKLREKGPGEGDVMLWRAMVRTREEAIKEMHRPSFVLNAEGPIRDTDLIILDECFVRGTLVDTPKGYVSIDKICVGDIILNAAGQDEVMAVRKKEAVDCAQIKFGGKTITCSRDHRFFTQRGVVRASDLNGGTDWLVRVPSAMRFLRPYISSKNTNREVLFPEMLNELVDAISGIQSKDLYGREEQEGRRGTEEISKLRNPGSNQTGRSHCGPKSNGQPSSEGEDQRGTQSEWMEAAKPGRQRSKNAGAGKEIMGRDWSGVDTGICSIYWTAALWLADLFQIGPREPTKESSNRSRRNLTSVDQGASGGQKKGSLSDFYRVDSVEVLEQGDPRLDQFRDADGKLYLYDIQASRHSSFGVCGALVHNCSMVGPEMAADVMSFGKPILVLGDPGQLPPIKGEGAFTQAEPDVMLSEIHRQAEGSAIIRLATMAREGKFIPYGTYSDTVCKLHKNDLGPEDLLGADQVGCGYNATRLMLNNAMRKAGGHTSVIPDGPTDKVMCLKNQNDIGLVNGTFLTMTDIENGNEVQFQAEIETDDGKKLGRRTVYKGNFLDHVQFDKERSQKDHWHKRGLVDATFGSACTIHKLQGSGFKNMIWFDDGFGRGEDRNKHSYTAITRAEEGLVILA